MLRLLLMAAAVCWTLTDAFAGCFVPFRSDLPFYAEVGAGTRVFFRSEGFSVVFAQKRAVAASDASLSRLYRLSGIMENMEMYRIDFRPEGNNACNWTAEELTDETIRYYSDRSPFGNAAVTARKLVCKNAFPNIDWVFYFSSEGQLKYDFVLHPGADPQKLRLRIDGSRRIDLNPSTQTLTVASSAGSWAEEIPCAFLTEKPGFSQTELKVKFRLKSEVLSFDIPDYDRTRTLVIDPLVRVWATLAGGMNMDHVSDMASDLNGNLYVTGFTASPDFPVTPGTLISKPSGGNDAFVACFAPDGRRKWATYFGGKGEDRASAVAVSSAGKIAFTGLTVSTALPLAEKKNAGATDAFLAELSNDGTLLYAAFVGGKAHDEGTGIGYDSENGIIMTGTTESSDFPVSAQAFQSRFQSGGTDAFLTRWDDKKNKSWATFLGGGLPDAASDLAVFQNLVYVTGTTSSRNFPITGTATVTARTVDPNGDLFLACFNHSGAREWVTCFGGNNRDEGLSVTVDKEGTPSVCGLTLSRDFPVTKNAFQTAAVGLAEGFIAQFTSGGEPLWSTFIGGSMIDHCFGITASRSDKSLIITGKTNSKNFPTTADALMFLSVGGFDSFIAQFSNVGKQVWTSYYGSSADDEAYAAASAPGHAFYMGGRTVGRNFPLTADAFQSDLKGSWDAFAVKFEEKNPDKSSDENPVFTPREIPPDENIFTFKSTVKNVSCKGGTDGAIDLTVTGGTPPYTFSWSNGATTEDLKNIPAGKYSVEVTDVNGLSQKYYIETGPNAYKEVAIEVKEPANGTQITLTPVPPACPNTRDGKIMSVISGGQAPFTVRWSNGSTEPSLKGVDAGNYSVTVTDANGCQATATTRLEVPSALTAVSSANNASCGGSNDGKITLTVSGGSPPYAYSWSGGQTTKDLTGLSGGNFSVTVTDKNGCSTSVTTIVSQGAAVTASAEAAPAKCDGAADASVKLTVTGGTPPFLYKWSNQMTVKDLINVLPGTYSVTVTDKNNCTAVASAVVQQAVPLKLTVTSTNPLCFDTQNGAAEAAVVGGKEPYLFAWSDGQSTAKIIRLNEGNYTLTVTDANGCKKTASVTLKKPAQLTAAALTEGGSCTQPDKPAKINLNITGGTPPHNIAWSNGSNAKELTGIPPGEYTATVTDAFGCSTTVKSVIKQFTPMQVTVMAKEPGCEGGNTAGIDLTPSGGQSPISFAWSSGQKTEDLTGIPAGLYTVTLTDANKCNFTQTIEIKKKEPLKLIERITAVSCNGGTNGEIEIALSGGQSPYLFRWSSGGSENKITGLKAGSYEVEITDANGCKIRKEITLTQPEILSVKTNKTDASCEKGNDGKIIAVTAGGTPPYKYEWSNGAVTPNLAGIPDGTYTLKVTDGKGCTAVANAQITRPKPFNIEVSKTDLTCSGQNDGTAGVITKEGTPPFTYLWSNGLATSEIKNQKEGPLTVTVTDAAGCKQTGSVTLARPPAMTLRVKIDNITCNPNTDGKVEALITGGTPPFSFKWSNNGLGEKIENLAEGSYSVTVSDGKGCTKTETATVKKPSLLTVSLNPKNVSCNGDKDASINAKVAGGTEPYKYNWSNGSNTPALLNIEAGKYILTVTDANGCLTSGEATVIKPAGVNVSLQGKNLSCSGQNDGSAKAVVSGGKEPFTYLWSNGKTTQEVTGLKEGDLSVTVTDANGCKAQDKTTLTRPPAMTLKVNKKDISCADRTDGSIEAIVTGGKEPFYYKWGNNNAVEKSLTGLAEGSYALTVTDANGCTQNTSVNIKKPGALSVNLNPKNVSCNGEKDASVNAKVSGGTEPYKYSWSNGTNTPALLNIEAGKYSLTVTDANGCITSGEATVIKPAGVSVSIEGKNLSCSGQNDGSAKAVISGGKEPFTYAWSNGKTTSEITGLKEGDFSVTVTDANGCKSKETTTLSRPPAVTVKVKKKDISCATSNDGTTETVITGGKEPFTFKWSNEKTGSSIDNLSDGTFTVTVTDKNGCTGTATATVKRPAPLAVNVTGKNVSCTGDKDGSVIAKVSGGTEPYKYSWDGGSPGVNASLTGLEAGKYRVTVTDGNGCTASGETSIIKPVSVTVIIDKKDLSCSGQNDGSAKAVISGGNAPYVYLWSTGSAKSEITGLKEGDLSVTVTDANGCKANAKAVFFRPTALTLKVSKKEITCANVSDGKAEIKVLTGKEPFTYAWSNGKSGAVIEELGEGTFTVTVSDASGCKAVQAITFKKPLAVNVTITAKNVSCGGTNDGGATAKVTGGSEPYKYLWSNGNSTATLTGAEAGSYKLTVTDANGCVGEGSVTIIKPDALSVSLQKTNISCTGTNDGSAKAVVTGGKAPFTYAWSNLLTGQEVKNLKEGEITVTVTDANGCKSVAKETIIKPGSLTVKATAKGLSCADAADGSAEIGVSGGKEPYTYLWSNQKTTQNIEKLGDGTFTVTVSDANGCKGTASVTVKKPEAVKVALYETNLSCSGKNDGKITSKVSGGTAPYKLEWSKGGSGENLTELDAGEYSLTVTDANGCKNSAKVELKRPPVMSLKLESADAKCFGGKDGSVKTVISGGTEPFTYLWSSGEKTKNLNGVASGEYSVTVTDAKGCNRNEKITLTQPSRPSIIPDGPEVICEGQKRKLSVAEGYKSYKWSNGETAASIEVNKPGSYGVEMVTESGCKTSAAAVKITLAAPPPTPEITVQGDSLIASPADRYQWFLNNAIIPTGIDRVWVAKEKGEYKVKVSTMSGCSAISPAKSVTPKAQPIKGKENAIEVYPNPTTGNANLTVLNLNGEALTVTITSPSGKSVFTKTISALDKKYEENITIKEDGGETGRYIITVKSKTKVIKETITVN